MEDDVIMKKTLSLTYGAMTVALTGIILFFDRITAGFFMTFLALPLIVYGSYCDLSDAFVVYISCILMAVIMSGLFSTVLMMAGYGAVGLAYIYSMKRNDKPLRSYLVMGVVIALFYFIMIRFFGPAFGMDFQEMLQSVKAVLNVHNPILINVISVGMVLLTMVMELFIIKTSADIVLVMLHRNRK